MLTIAAGTAVGQVLALCAAPVLTRLFSPSDFGILTITTALAASFAAVAALRLELAVPLPESERDARSLVALGLLVAAASGAIGMILVAAGGGWVAQLFDEPALRPWLWFVPLYASIVASYALLNQLAIRHQRYGAVGRRNLVSSVMTLSTQISTGAAGLRPGGLVLGLTAGQLVGAASLLKGSGLRSAESRGAGSVASMRSVLTRYRRFPLLLAPAGLLNVLGLQLPILLIAFSYGSAVAGWLGLTQRVLALPVMLVGQAIAQVYLGELSRDQRENGGRTRALFYRTSARLAGASLVGAAGLLLFAPAMFRLVFGAEWTTSGDYARALALGLAAQMVAYPLSQTLVVLGRQGQQLAWDAGRLLLTVGVVMACASLHVTAMTAVWALGVALALSYFAGWWMAYRATAALPTQAPS